MAKSERRALLAEERDVSSLNKPLPPPRVIEYHGREFLDTPEKHGMTLASYTVTLNSIAENMHTFMVRRFSVVGDIEVHTNLSDAPILLNNYLEVEALVRGFNPLPETVRLHLLEHILGAWGFHHTGMEFALPNQHALNHIFAKTGGSPRNFIDPQIEQHKATQKGTSRK